MKKIIKYSVAFSMVLVLGLMCAITYLNISLPKEFYVFENKNLKINEYITVASETTSVAKPVNYTVGGSYNTKLLLFNSIPIKTVKVGVIDETYVVPCGTPFGIKMFTNGVIVVGTSDVD
ncbi:MAG: SpoIVB peptidase, partial [Oscillospiraceae bacterium]|nr:SpoIVB peptidase [Oscillospiraceae bacterium]